MSDENRKLTEFCSDDGGGGERDDPTGDRGGAIDDRSDEHGTSEGDRSDVAPAVSTATWSPDGASCDDCGSVVQRRWRDGGALVCVDCAEW